MPVQTLDIIAAFSAKNSQYFNYRILRDSVSLQKLINISILLHPLRVNIPANAITRRLTDIYKTIDKTLVDFQVVAKTTKERATFSDKTALIKPVSFISPVYKIIIRLLTYISRGPVSIP